MQLLEVLVSPISNHPSLLYVIQILHHLLPIDFRLESHILSNMVSKLSIGGSRVGQVFARVVSIVVVASVVVVVTSTCIRVVRARECQKCQSHIAYLSHPSLVYIIQRLLYLLPISFRLNPSIISNNNHTRGPAVQKKTNFYSGSSTPTERLPIVLYAKNPHQNQSHQSHSFTFSSPLQHTYNTNTKEFSVFKLGYQR